jgi:bifunctional polynucleotide phosphatase/kinase
VSIKSEAPRAGKPSPRLFVIKAKVTNMLNNLNICTSFYGATEHDNYRKPRSGMWKEALEHYDLDENTVDMDRSFYVGDAAGREGDGQKSDADFASSDR